MSITIKAFLKIGDDINGEIRRFVVDPDEGSSFEFITKKLMQVFPSLESEGLQVAWKDSDGDLITFSSDEELGEALEQLTEGVFRIYVQRKSPPPQAPGQAVEVVYHPEFSCGGCGMGISGPCFKCVVCPEYYLCQLCEKRGTHSEHDFMIIRKRKFDLTFRSGHGVNLEQQIIGPWSSQMVEDGANQDSLNTQLSTFLVHPAAKIPLPGAIKGPGRFLGRHEVLHTMTSKQPTSRTVPPGLKENVYFLLDNSDNVARQQLHLRGAYVDDCGAWAKQSMKTHYYVITGADHKLEYIDLRDGQYCTVVKKVRTPMDPQPGPDSIMAFKRYYMSLKRSKTYRKRISTVHKCPENLDSLKYLAVVEYMGPYPYNIKSCHGNSKTATTEYIRKGAKSTANEDSSTQNAQ